MGHFDYTATWAMAEALSWPASARFQPSRGAASFIQIDHLNAAILLGVRIFRILQSLEAVSGGQQIVSPELEARDNIALDRLGAALGEALVVICRSFGIGVSG